MASLLTSLTFQCFQKYRYLTSAFIKPGHPLRSRIMDKYNSMVTSVQNHSKVPSFMAKSQGKAPTIELEWDGSQYTAKLTDTNNVLGNYTFSSDYSAMKFTTSGNVLTIASPTAPTGNVTVSASKKDSKRMGLVVWDDGSFGPGVGQQNTVTYTQSVTDPIAAYLKLNVSYGSAKIVKTSEDGKVEGVTFRITGNGIDQTVTTNSRGEVQIDNLQPGEYTVTEQMAGDYVPQEPQKVTVQAGQTATVSFNNSLQKGSLTVTKNSEDGLNSGVRFHLYGTSSMGETVDLYATTNSSGVAQFTDVPIGSGYTLEEVDTAVRYVVPSSQSVNVEWEKATNLMMVLSAIPDIEITCTDSCECFDDNQAYLRGRLQEEGNPLVRQLLEQDREMLDRAQAEMATARQFLFISRCKGMKADQVFQAVNRIEKVISEQGFEVRRMRKSDIKRFLAIYFDASMNGDQMPDTDGGQFFEVQAYEPED